MVTSRRDLGDFGERVAAHRLEAAGMRVVARNVRFGRIEVDFIAEDGDSLVFVEVRTRRGREDWAAASVTPAKLRRMWQFAAGYCDANAIPLDRARIDLVAIDLDGDGTARHVEHFRGLEVPEGLD